MMMKTESGKRSAVTFVSVETWSACEVGGGGKLRHQETVHADGRVEFQVTGRTDEQGAVNERGVRYADESLARPLDLDSVERARVASGWVVVS